jgi:hypothetical protein
MTECPYCGESAETVQDEIEHMSSMHPGIIRDRLLKAGFSWEEIEDRLASPKQTYEYKKINISLEPKRTIEAAANRWGAMGWQVVSVMEVSSADRRAGFSDSILVVRKKETA